MRALYLATSDLLTALVLSICHSVGRDLPGTGTSLRLEHGRIQRSAHRAAALRMVPLIGTASAPYGRGRVVGFGKARGGKIAALRRETGGFPRKSGGPQCSMPNPHGPVFVCDLLVRSRSLLEEVGGAAEHSQITEREYGKANAFSNCRCSVQLDSVLPVTAVCTNYDSGLCVLGRGGGV